MAVQRPREIEPLLAPNQMTPCQLHEGRFTTEGYGWVMLGGKQVLAHRLAYALGHAADPSGMVVRHTCNNPPCVNPEHLISGTHADNMADKILSGVVRGERNPASKLTEQDVRGVKCLRRLGVRNSEIASLLGVTQTMVGYIVTGRKWGHVGQ